MTKTELMENYTADQLAEMVVKLQKEKNSPKDEPIYLPKEYMGAVREILNIDTSEIKDDCHRFSVESLQRYLKIGEPRKLSEVERLQSEVEKYRKAFEDAKKERDCQIAEYRKKIEKLATENRSWYVSLQQDPIDIASNLIKTFCWQGKEYLPLECIQLRQIAEHLLVYCNHNKEEEE